MLDSLPRRLEKIKEIMFGEGTAEVRGLQRLAMVKRVSRHEQLVHGNAAVRRNVCLPLTDRIEALEEALHG